MQQHNSFASILFVTLAGAAVAACTSDGGNADTMTGAARYADASTDAGGAPRQPASPPAQRADLTLTVEGTGVITNVEPTCLDALAGRFDAVYGGNLDIGGDGAYSAGFGSAVASLTTPSGCTIPTFTVTAITRISARAEIAASAPDCQSYCAASARSDAEASCAGAADQTTCRAQVEAAATASCTTTCTQQAHAIVAEASIGVDSLGSLDAAALRSAALGQLTADLTFDHMVDAGGHVVGQ